MILWLRLYQNKNNFIYSIKLGQYLKSNVIYHGV